MTEPIPKLSAPIVLVHGLCGLDRLLVCRRPVKEYFPGIRAFLTESGNEVYVPRVSPTASIATRAAELNTYLDRTVGRRPVHLIGHSLGGLDARYLISRLGRANLVLSLTTVGTPHRGSAFADWCIDRLYRFVRPAIRRAGMPVEAFFDLTTESCQRFNEKTPDVAGVRYSSVAGVCEKPWLGPEWMVPHRIVGRAEGPNDGVVSVASATWGERTVVWAGDHLNLVNWPNRKARRQGVWRDRATDYGELVRGLASAGI